MNFKCLLWAGAWPRLCCWLRNAWLPNGNTQIKSRQNNIRSRREVRGAAPVRGEEVIGQWVTRWLSWDSASLYGVMFQLWPSESMSEDVDQFYTRWAWRVYGPWEASWQHRRKQATKCLRVTQKEWVFPHKVSSRLIFFLTVISPSLSARISIHFLWKINSHVL